MLIRREQAPASSPTSFSQRAGAPGRGWSAEDPAAPRSGVSNLNEGFARVRCPDCHHEYLLAFSCRGRWFCPSCHAKKVILFGQHLRDNVLYPVPHRQYVFSIPIILRRFFKYDRKLLGKLWPVLCSRLGAGLRPGSRCKWRSMSPWTTW